MVGVVGVVDVVGVVGGVGVVGVVGGVGVVGVVGGVGAQDASTKLTTIKQLTANHIILFILPSLFIFLLPICQTNLLLYSFR